MAHEDAGHYGAKHLADRKLNEKIAGAVREKNMDGKISCAEASRIAGQLQVSMADVGGTIDLLEIHVKERLSCLSAWEIAEETGSTRMAISSACEKLKIKIKPCQLGAF